MPGTKKTKTEIYIPVLNEKTIKKINHWDLGPINSDWHLHMSSNHHIQDLILYCQQQAAARFHFFNVLRFYLEDTSLDNNQHIESASLGIILHAYKTVTSSEMTLGMSCVSGSLYKNGEGGLTLKTVDRIEEKFLQFADSLQLPAYNRVKKCCFICVAESGETVQLKKKLEVLLAVHPVNPVKEIGIIVYEHGEKLENILAKLLVHEKKRIHLLTISILAGLILAGAISLFVFFRNQHEIHNNFVEYSEWSKQADLHGSELSLNIIPGKTNKTLEISFTIVKDGWVLISKQITGHILKNANGIGFYFKGEGARNSVEVKLIYSNETTFGVLYGNQSVTDGWKQYKIALQEFKCWWPESECNACNNTLDKNDVFRIHIALSNKQEDIPGSGKALISDFYYY